MYPIIDKYIEKLMTSNPNMPLWNIESILNGKKPAWNYIDGCMITSLLELYKTTKEEKYLNFVVNFVDYYVFDDGSIRGYDPLKYSTDDVCESRILFDLYKITNNEKYNKAIELTYTQVQNHPRTKEGNFWHKAIYPNQVWLDGLYMMQPFYIRYQTERGIKDYSDTINQFENVYRIMFDKEKKLYYHGYDSSKQMFWCNKKTGLSKNFWLRSIGWYTVGLIDCIDYIAEDHTKEKERLIKIFKETIAGILLYQDEESKMFYQLPNLKDVKGNYLETSGSSMIAYAILKAVRLGVLDKTYQAIGKGIFDGICKKYLSVNKDGDLNLGGICLVAGLGPNDKLRRDGSVEYYLSEPIVENDAKGTGPLIMAYTEILKI